MAGLEAARAAAAARNLALQDAAFPAPALHGPNVLGAGGFAQGAPAAHPAPNPWGALDEKNNKFKATHRPRATLMRGLSCGVGNFSGFYGGGDGQSYFKDLLFFFKKHWQNNQKTIYSRVGNFLPCATVFWSDHPGGNGDKLADYINEQFPDNPVAKQPGVNPQSGKKLVTCMWTPDADAVVAHPVWAELDVGGERMSW